MTRLTRMRALLVALLTASAAVPTAAVAAPAKNGYWRSNAGGYLVEVRVERHRVVGLTAELDTTPVAGNPAAQCGGFDYGFVGPFSAGSSSTTKRFAISDPAFGVEAEGAFASARKLTGTIRVLASSRYQCELTQRFVVRYESAG